MEVLRIKIFQPKACYTTPLSAKGIETFPLPPYSTLRGMVYNAMGRKYRVEDEIEFSIQGKYSAIYRDYWNAVKFGQNGREKKPIQVPTLHNVELLTHIKSNILDEIEEAMKKPNMYLALGRADDLIQIVECKRVSLEERDLRDFHSRPLISHYSSYIPIEKANELGIRGIFYRLNYFYQIRENYRVFVQTKDVFYVGAPYIIEDGTILVDKDGDKEFPVWF